MSIIVGLHHVTRYGYDKPIGLGPQIIRLRPAPHCRTRIPSYSLTVTPAQHFVNWQQDPHGNWLARFVFPEKTTEFSVTVDLARRPRSDQSVRLLSSSPTRRNGRSSFRPNCARTLPAYVSPSRRARGCKALIDSIAREPHNTVDFLVELNQRLHSIDALPYPPRARRADAGGDARLRRRARAAIRRGCWCSSCATSACRRASSPAISSSFEPDLKPLDGPAGTEHDFTDLHAWTEVYLPGAGWIGLDPTSGLLCGEGHLPVAATPHYRSAAPISGLVEPSKVDFAFDMSVARIAEKPRVTAPFSDEAWAALDALGEKVDADLVANDVRLTMGGEPTFVSIDDYQSAEWNTAALGADQAHPRRRV